MRPLRATLSEPVGDGAAVGGVPSGFHEAWGARARGTRLLRVRGHQKGHHHRAAPVRVLYAPRSRVEAAVAELLLLEACTGARPPDPVIEPHPIRRRERPPLRVLQVTPRVAPHVGGVETHVREVVSRLSAHDVESAILTTDETRRLPPRAELDGVPVIRAAAWPRGRDLLFAPEVFTGVQRGNWDVVHVQSYHTLVAPLAMTAAARARIPYVVTFHGGGHSSRLRNAIRGPQLRLLRPLLARARALVSVAEFEIEHYGAALGLPRGRFVTIPNGADLPAPSAEAPPISGRLIVSSGRLERYKGHERVLRAVPHVLAAIPDAWLWIAGAGPRESELHRLAAGARGVPTA